MTIAALVKNIQERRKKPDIYEHSFPKSSIIVERFPVSNSYITAHAHRLKKNPKNMLLSWIYYRLFTMLDVLRPGSTIWYRRYAQCMNDTRACKGRHHNIYLCKMMRIHWEIFQRVSFFYSLLTAVSTIAFSQKYNYKI